MSVKRIKELIDEDHQTLDITIPNLILRYSNMIYSFIRENVRDAEKSYYLSDRKAGQEILFVDMKKEWLSTVAEEDRYNILTIYHNEIVSMTNIMIADLFKIVSKVTYLTSSKADVYELEKHLRLTNNHILEALCAVIYMDEILSISSGFQSTTRFLKSLDIDMKDETKEYTYSSRFANYISDVFLESIETKIYDETTNYEVIDKYTKMQKLMKGLGIKKKNMAEELGISTGALVNRILNTTMPNLDIFGHYRSDGAMQYSSYTLSKYKYRSIYGLEITAYSNDIDHPITKSGTDIGETSVHNNILDHILTQVLRRSIKNLLPDITSAPAVPITSLIPNVRFINNICDTSLSSDDNGKISFREWYRKNFATKRDRIYSNGHYKALEERHEFIDVMCRIYGGYCVSGDPSLTDPDLISEIMDLNVTNIGATANGIVYIDSPIYNTSIFCMIFLIKNKNDENKKDTNNNIEVQRLTYDIMKIKQLVDQRLSALKIRLKKILKFV